MIKHIFWVFPVGVAAGLSLPLLIPVRETPKPLAPPPPQPIVSIEGFELKPSVPKTSLAPSMPLVAEKTDTDLGSLASSSIVVPASAEPAKKKRRVRHIDSRTLRRLQDEDSRAFQAADRMLMYERKGA